MDQEKKLVRAALGTGSQRSRRLVVRTPARLREPWTVLQQKSLPPASRWAPGKARNIWPLEPGVAKRMTVSWSTAWRAMRPGLTLRHRRWRLRRNETAELRI